MKHHAKRSIRFCPLLTSSAGRLLTTGIAVIQIILVLSSFSAQAGTNTIDLHAFAAPESAVKAIVPVDRVVWLNLVTTKPSNEKVEISLTEFRDGHGNAVPVYFMPGTGSERERTIRIKIQLDRDRFTLRLDASALLLDRVYTGELWVKEPKEPLKQFTIQLETRKIELFQGAPSKAVSLDVAVPTNGITTVSLEAATLRSYGAKADFHLSSFLGQDSGIAAQVYLLDEGQSRQNILKDVPLDKDTIAIVLDATGLAPGETYLGTLSTKIERHSLPPFVLKLTRKTIPRDAVIAVDKPIPIKVTCYYKCKPPTINVVLQEKSGKRPLIGISVEADSPPGEGSLIPATDLLVTLNSLRDGGQKIENLWQLNPDNAAEVKRRSVLAGGQAVMHVEFPKKLPPGKYQTVLKVRSLNAKLDELPELAITVEIKYPWWYALIVLIVAVLVSYLAAKGICTKMRRVKLAAQVSNLKNAYWLQRDRSGALPVVRVKAVLSRVQKALANEKGIVSWFSVPGTLEAQFKVVETRLPYLSRLCACRAYWELSNDDPMVVRRAQKGLRGIIQEFADSPFEKYLNDDIKEKLANLEKWENQEELPGFYWLDLLKDIRQLQYKVQGQLRHFDSPALKQLEMLLDQLLSLMADLKQAMNLLESVKNNLSATNSMDTSDTLSSANELLHNFYMSSVKPVYDLLREAGEGLKKVENSGTAELEEKLKKIRAELETGRLVRDWQTATGVAQKLDAITSLHPQELERQIQQVRKLLREVAKRDPSRIEAELKEADSALETIKLSDREIVRELLFALKPDLQPEGLHEAIQRERTYAALKVIWEQRNDKEMIKELINLQKENRALEELFHKVDTLAWKRLRGKINVELRGSEGDVETYQLFDLEARPDNDKLGGNYLFKHGLVYEWTIDFGESPLTPKTREPRVTQFIPIAKKEIKASVKITFEELDDSMSTNGFKFSSKPSGEFGLIKAFQSVEVIALLLALLAAVGTGMNSSYYETALEGSTQSYVALFFWGIAADQVKNVLQNLKSYMGNEG
ncbi:MAG: hypothetical protein BA874_13085 [Desulfuromonadales bacterium C00003068]|nr:MAG: hypothetical protein BA874_13085 [Desulfuromonadales bacterium C00003068]